MNEEMKSVTSVSDCGCEEGSCSHQEEINESGLVASLKKHRGSDEIALAFLLALTPLVVLTFFGQVGLI